jgi:hypothetical protein
MTAAISSLSRTQQAIARMVSDSCKFKWTSYCTADRAVARQKVLAAAANAPERLPDGDLFFTMQGKKHEKCKAFLFTLANALEDSTWKVL